MKLSWVFIHLKAGGGWSFPALWLVGMVWQRAEPVMLWEGLTHWQQQRVPMQKWLGLQWEGRWGL